MNYPKGFLLRLFLTCGALQITIMRSLAEEPEDPRITKAVARATADGASPEFIAQLRKNMATEYANEAQRKAAPGAPTSTAPRVAGLASGGAYTPDDVMRVKMAEEKYDRNYQKVRPALIARGDMQAFIIDLQLTAKKAQELKDVALTGEAAHTRDEFLSDVNKSVEAFSKSHDLPDPKGKDEGWTPRKAIGKYTGISYGSYHQLPADYNANEFYYACRLLSDMNGVLEIDQARKEKEEFDKRFGRPPTSPTK
jgi:hypothetical protein